jgi:hypothetical protein
VLSVLPIPRYPNSFEFFFNSLGALVCEHRNIRTSAAKYARYLPLFPFIVTAKDPPQNPTPSSPYHCYQTIIKSNSVGIERERKGLYQCCIPRFPFPDVVQAGKSRLVGHRNSAHIVIARDSAAQRTLALTRPCHWRARMPFQCRAWSRLLAVFKLRGVQAAAPQRGLEFPS